MLYIVVFYILAKINAPLWTYILMGLSMGVKSIYLYDKFGEHQFIDDDI